MARSMMAAKTAMACVLALAVSFVCICGLTCEQAQAASVGEAKISSITAKYVGEATVKAKKVTDAKGYEFRIGTNKAVTKNVAKKTAKKPKATFKGLKLNKTYYVKVRAYTKKNGKKVYGKWSKVRSCKFTYDMDNYDYCMGQGDYYKAQYELQKSKRASLMKTGPGMYNPALAQNDPTYRTRYYQQVREHNAKISEAESNMEYYEKLMNEWYADATSQYWFYGYPRY